jgi:pimeloyl-ACP methyl ester carboxylesterase
LFAFQVYPHEIETLSKRYQVIAFDYPGVGQSTHDVLYPDEREVDLWGFWADLACHLLLELKINACCVLGVGGGALTALHFAGKQAPQHKLAVKGMIADSFLADWNTRNLHRWLDVCEHFYVRNWKLLQQIHGDNWREFLDQDTAFLRQLADRGGYAVPDCILNSISGPVLLTGQLQDPVLPGLAQEYARISCLIPDCSIYLSSKSNHPYLERPYMWTDPARFWNISDSFLERIGNKV